jgi:hypothetical protein
MAMIRPAAKLIIPKMSVNDCDYCGNQEPKLPFMPDLLSKQEQYPDTKKDVRTCLVVMPLVAMPKCIGSNNEGDEDHKIFKRLIINDVGS